VSRPINTFVIPDEVDDVTMAAIAIPAMSSWAALTERAHMAAAETVFINGATGASGRLAIQIAKHLGAKKVIATGRNEAQLTNLSKLGADVMISLRQSKEELDLALRREFNEASGLFSIISGENPQSKSSR
jgi:NADPH:quinone reductase-like Zn-dependent oxidoreductase